MSSENDGRGSANSRQVGGDHYKRTDGEEHWDRMWRLYGPGYFVGCITKYVERYEKKDGIKDLDKARHFLDKLIELETARTQIVATLIPEKQVSYAKSYPCCECGQDYPGEDLRDHGHVLCSTCREKDEVRQRWKQPPRAQKVDPTVQCQRLCNVLCDVCGDRFNSVDDGPDTQSTCDKCLGVA